MVVGRGSVSYGEVREWSSRISSLMMGRGFVGDIRAARSILQLV